MAALEQALADPHPNAVASIRGQIERITLTPNDEGGLEIHLYGDLARILEFCEAAEGKRGRAGRGCKRERPGRGGPGRGLAVVAGACNTFCLLLFATRRIGWR